MSSDVPEYAHESMCTTKKGFASKRAARQALRTANKIRKGYLRTYECPLCHWWHLTSQRKI